ncbi:hypothetical protein [Burkholderia ambifaria]|uniref:hypothetical protein n=1 Tax=Burkholderia ambifaria TaxID=152480 RepID=UPI00158E265A|nr:hypothetical protein [Burkholderia ambifaria]MBR8348301.1 hypothetical protein [Burkholderia ambifaria]
MNGSNSFPRVTYGNNAYTTDFHEPYPAPGSAAGSGTGPASNTQPPVHGMPPAFHGRPSSAPTTTDPAFAAPYSSVRRHGILPQNQMRAQNIAFNQSHDGQVERNNIDVTRIQGSSDPQQRARAARMALENPAHGALSVALERHGYGPLHTETHAPSMEEVLSSLNPQQRKDFNDAVVEYGMKPEEVLAMMAKDQQTTSLSPQGQSQAYHRMQNTFMVTAHASAPAAYASPYEDTRHSIPPSEFRSVYVPQSHAHTARQVDRELAARQSVYPQAVVVPDRPGMNPYYQASNGNGHQIHGVQAPDYYNALRAQSSSEEDYDAHLVKTGIQRGW